MGTGSLLTNSVCWKFNMALAMRADLFEVSLGCIRSSTHRSTIVSDFPTWPPFSPFAPRDQAEMAGVLSTAP
jgi:hypothetical protein